MNHFFDHFIDEIKNTANGNMNFSQGSKSIEAYVNSLPHNEFIEIVKEIGMIPEQIEASSTEEKLFSKASDCILSRSFFELGLKSVVSEERSNSADIVAESMHGYTLVADAKTFRLSRTAKNQKDFKISTLSAWRGSEHDYALLVAPYFQYPKISSQIYSSALDHEVCLLAWEHILFLLSYGIRETDDLSLESIWKAPTRLIRNKNLAYADRMNCHISEVDEFVFTRISKTKEDFISFLNEYKKQIIERGIAEISFLNIEKRSIEQLSREEAIEKLIKNKKYNERISTINKYICSLH